jgi:hypothetical protein
LRSAAVSVRPIAYIAWTLACLGCDRGPSTIDVHLDRDASADAALPEIVLPDSGPPCGGSCAPAGPCEDARCEDGACVRRLRSDGEACTEDASRLCVEGECRARGCGDGWRESGTDTGYPREGCDDGFDADGDLCDGSCVPREGILASGIDVAEPRDLALALDADGRGLVLVVERSDTESVVRALRLDRRLREDRERLTLASSPRAHADWALAAAGLAGGGFAIALAREPDGLVVGVLGSEDATPPAWVSLDGPSVHAAPAVAAVGDGFVVAATDVAGSPDDPFGGIRARSFDAEGRPIGAPFAVAEDRSGIESDAAIAAVGSIWRIAWSVHDAMGRGHDVRTRPFLGDLAVGPEVSGDATSGIARFAPSIAALDGAFALAWIEASSAGLAARAIRLAEDGAASAPASIVSGGRALYTSRALPLDGDAYALLCVEGAGAPTPRWTSSGAAPPELALVERAAAGGIERVAIDAERIVLAWPAPDANALRALVLPRH